MKRFPSWFRHTPATRTTSARRPQLEQFEDRVVPSTLSSAISIPHVLYYGSLKIPWTERDWYTVDRSTNHVIEFKGTTRYDLGGPTDVVALSASIDPKTGFGEVFALRANGNIWRCDSSGNWHQVSWAIEGSFSSISATRDGSVFASDAFSGLSEFDSNGIQIGLGIPPGGVSNNSVVAASVAGGGLFGSGDEAFVIGANQAIYVHVGNQWNLVDNSAQFVSLSATRDNTVFAVTTSGKLYQETESIKLSRIGNIWIFQTYWVGHDISAGLTFTPTISADLDASGQSEVYAVDVYGTLYQYDQGVYSEPWTDVTDVSGADGGYYYHVQYWYGHYDGYLNYTYVGSNLS
jgi:hypothetical protein